LFTTCKGKIVYFGVHFGSESDLFKITICFEQ
jgi:hypothetical protein